MGFHPPEGEEISSLANQGDSDALEILAINADAVGEVAAMLADGLDRILIGSLARYLGEPWPKQLRQSFRRGCFP